MSTPTRIAPAASAFLYPPGGEGYLLDGGFDLYDIPSHRMQKEEDYVGRAYKAWEYTYSTRTVNGDATTQQPSIEALREINTVCPRPRMVQQDTPTSQYNYYGATCQNIRTLDSPNKSRLVQISTTPNSVWRIESKYFLPANPNLAFTIARLKPAQSNDGTNYPPKVQVVIADLYQVRLSDRDDSGIWGKVNGTWKQLIHLDLSDVSKEIVVWMIVRRGCVMFSFNEGKKWETIRDIVPLSIPSGKILSIEGVSCQASFGFHQLAFDDCWYQTFELPTLEIHYGASYFNMSQTYAPALTSLTPSMQPSSPASAKYRMDFKVASTFVTNLSFNMYSVPEVYGVMITWDPIWHPPISGGVDLVSIGVVDEIDISEGEDLTDRSGSINIQLDNTTPLTGSYGWRRVDISLGYEMSDGSYELLPRCAMYIIEPGPEARDYDNNLKFELVDLWERAAATVVDEGWAPMDGLTAIQARNYVLAKMGLPSWRANWYNTEAILPSGLPDNPRWRPEPGKMSAADVFRAIDVFEGVQTFVASDGDWVSQPARYFDTFYTERFDAGLPLDPKVRIKELRYKARQRDGRTAVLVADRDNRDGSFWASAINYNLERVPTASGFVGFRIWDRVDYSNAITLVAALNIAQYRLSLYSDIPYVAQLKVAGCPYLYRKNAIAIDNAEPQGIISANGFAVASLTNRWRPDKKSTETEITAYRKV